jgi:hypothetical protein
MKTTYVWRDGELVEKPKKRPEYKFISNVYNTRLELMGRVRFVSLDDQRRLIRGEWEVEPDISNGETIGMSIIPPRKKS